MSLSFPTSSAFLLALAREFGYCEGSGVAQVIKHFERTV
jgi:hypothetical protein